MTTLYIVSFHKLEASLNYIVRPSQTKQKYISGLLLLQILKKQPHPTVFREIIGSDKLEG